MFANSLRSCFSSLKKTTQLKNLIHSKDLSFIMEAHNGLSAAIVEETGFKGIWGSGLSISAAMGVRDSNEASYTQVSKEHFYLITSFSYVNTVLIRVLLFYL